MGISIHCTINHIHTEMENVFTNQAFYKTFVQYSKELTVYGVNDFVY